MNGLYTPTRHKLTIDDYHKMGQVGILSEVSRVELIEGELIDRAPIGSHHSGLVKRLIRLFDRQIGDLAIVSVQDPVCLPPDSEPQPDIMLLKPRSDWYRNSLPGASDVLLIVEVADTTASYDRNIKIPLYGKHGIPETWLIDLQVGKLEIYQDPRASGYRKLLIPEKHEIISPALLSSVELPLSEIWPE